MGGSSGLFHQNVGDVVCRPFGEALNLNVAVEMMRKILSVAKNAKYAKNQRAFTFSDVDSR